MDKRFDASIFSKKRTTYLRFLVNEEIAHGVDVFRSFRQAILGPGHLTRSHLTSVPMNNQEHIRGDLPNTCILSSEPHLDAQITWYIRKDRAKGVHALRKNRIVLEQRTLRGNLFLHPYEPLRNNSESWDFKPGLFLLMIHPPKVKRC